MSAHRSEVDRFREAFAAGCENARPSAECPSPERIWAAVRAEGSRRTARRIAFHAISCPACAEAWRLARDFGEAFPHAALEAEESPLAEPPAHRPRWGYAAALASATVVIAAVVFLLAPRRDAPVPLYRSAPAESVESLVPADSVLSRDAVVLKWSGPEGARYDLVVGTEDLAPLAEARSLERAEYRVPAKALTGLPHGARILWHVEAALPDGRLVSSRTFASQVE